MLQLTARCAPPTTLYFMLEPFYPRLKSCGLLLHLLEGGGRSLWQGELGFKQTFTKIKAGFLLLKLRSKEAIQSHSTVGLPRSQLVLLFRET